MKRLVVGPWLGEFGWELMSWQGFIRKAAAGYDEVVVSTYTGNEALYSDFCKKFIPHNVIGDRDCWWAKNYDVRSHDAIKHLLLKDGGDLLRPTAKIPVQHQSFVKYGVATRAKEKVDVLIHARAKQGRNPQHSWPRAQWVALHDKLRDAGLTSAAIGTEAHCPPDMIDRRNIPLQDLMDLLAASTMVVGPSSGTMHLASLCGTPHVVWTDKKVWASIGTTNRERYEKLWNPLKTACLVLDQFEWSPHPDAVMEAIQEGFKLWRK